MADFAKFDKIQGVTYQGLPIQKLQIGRAHV